MQDTVTMLSLLWVWVTLAECPSSWTWPWMLLWAAYKYRGTSALKNKCLRVLIFISKLESPSRQCPVWRTYQEGGVLRCHWLLCLHLTKSRAFTHNIVAGHHQNSQRFLKSVTLQSNQHCGRAGRGPASPSLLLLRLQDADCFLAFHWLFW